MSKNEIAWVDDIAPEDAAGRMQEIYAGINARNARVHNLYRAHSLRPETMEASDLLYHATLHCADNTLEPWLGELVATYTAALTRCHYAFVNHGATFKRCYPDAAQARQIYAALHDDPLEVEVDDRTRALLTYTRKLTLHPGDMQAQDVQALRDAGWSDGEIVETNQVCASFNYYVRCLNGLGTVLDAGDVGLLDA